MTVDRYGMPGDAMARAQRATRADSRIGRLPRVGDGMRRSVNLLDSLAQLTAIAMDRAALYGELLELQMYGPPIPDEDLADAAQRLYGAGRGDLDQPREEMDEPGEFPDADSALSLAARAVRGLVGVTGAAVVTGDGGTASFVATGEQSRELRRVEAEERDRAASLIKDCVKVGVKLDQVEVMRSYAGTISAALKAFVGEVGIPMNDEPVLRAAQRAGLTARRAVGHDDGDPDREIGPRMTATERVAALEAALARARREAASEAASNRVIEGEIT